MVKLLVLQSWHVLIRDLETTTASIHDSRVDLSRLG
jgi:hypothetical protein